MEGNQTRICSFFTNGKDEKINCDNLIEMNKPFTVLKKFQIFVASFDVPAYQVLRVIYSIHICSLIL